MSGHSKWSKIKRQKGAADKKKGKIFSKLSRAITIAAKDGGDPDLNYKLRLELDKAKEAGMPSDSVERAIKRGTGEGQEGQLDEVVYEGYGTGGAALLIQTATDNRNRTTSNLRHILSSFDGKLGEQGSVAYLFENKGQVLVPREGNPDLEEISLEVIDLGAEDVRESEEGLEIFTIPLEAQKIKDQLTEKGIKVESFGIIMEPTAKIELEKDQEEKLQKLIEALEDDDDVISVHTSADL